MDKFQRVYGEDNRIKMDNSCVFFDTWGVWIDEYKQPIAKSIRNICLAFHCVSGNC